MNLGLVTSFIIAGVLLVSILAMNLNVSSSNSELTLTQITKQHLQTVSEMISYDIPKIGFSPSGKVTGITNPSTGDPFKMITIADSNKIAFNGDVDNDGDIDSVAWEFSTTPVSTTENPNDYILVRTQGADETEITNGVTRFNIRYYDEPGKQKSEQMPTPVNSSALEDIKQIEIEVVLESNQKITYHLGSNDRYIFSAWEKRFTPINLQ